MSITSSIEWTSTLHADGTVTPGATWNPVTGCTKVSPGCDHCYAETFAERFRGTPGHPYEQGFDLKLWPDRLLLPHQWKKPRRIFVNSMSDLFHKDVPDEYILKVFNSMTLTPRHTYQILTKRPSRLVNTRLVEKIVREFYLVSGSAMWPSHIWLGVSVESQGHTWRVDALRRIVAPVRFISAEPLLGPLTLDLHNIAWLIAGAESGRDARPMNEDWVRSLRDQCTVAGVAFFYKQNAVNGRKIPTPELDGRTWKQFPEVEREVSRD